MDVEIGESKLPPGQHAAFQRQYYEPRVRPLVEEMRRHKQRLASLR